ncbi:EAL domain-containing protein [Oryzifoliimicrobium ureilyticus]|uniref:EAL domain-containing protein n=1 Tax=Oryzifoliimicrobium ureilyticus TaxID=3113724 RepID=UPI0030761EAC
MKPAAVLSLLKRGSLSTASLRAVLIVLMLMMAALGARIQPITQLDQDFVADRFSWAPRKASGKFVFLAIDKLTLDKVGVWPWPRSIYAEALEKLSAADVGDIFIDVDFSTPSTPSEDERFADALDAAGGGVLLPIFRQAASAGSRQASLSKPIPELLAKAWPVFADVPVDRDGVVRRFYLGGDADGSPVPSAGAALSGVSTSYGSQLIDFSITPASVPTYPLIDLLSGKIGKGELAGRSIVLGASAVELKDIFSVPTHPALAGPLIHILTAETQLQDRELWEIDQTLLNLGLAAALVIAMLRFRAFGLMPTSLSMLCIGAGVEAIAFFLQSRHGILLGTAVPWSLLALAWVIALNERINIGETLAALANRNARNSRRMIKSIIADSSDGIVTFDADQKVSEISAKAASLLGIGIGDPMAAMSEPVLAQAVRQLLAKGGGKREDKNSITLEFASGEGAFFEAVLTIAYPEGEGHGQEPAFGGSIVIRDITERKLYEQKLKHLAETDALTGLLNRRTFLDRIGEHHRSLVLLDIERFSNICSTLGREAGDGLLKAVANRLRDTMPDRLIARIDGDLFALLVADEGKPSAEQADDLLQLFKDPLSIKGALTTISVRIGLADCNIVDAESTLRAAESALDVAKSSPVAWAAYDPQMSLRQARARRLELDLRNALRQDELFLLFQPQIDLASGTFLGAEALLRWKHPELGLVSPAEFIPIAETSGQIVDIGRWVVMRACMEAASWPSGTVSVNVSALQFAQPDLEGDILQALSASGLPASRLCVELTESAFIDDNASSIGKMQALRSAGISLALDDFGTGYSSMSYLADLPLDKLKIDQAFIRRLNRDRHVRQIVKAIISLGHDLALGIIAEGIEHEDEMETLRQFGCEAGQGYLFGKPQSAADLIHRDRPARASA